MWTHGDFHTGSMRTKESPPWSKFERYNSLEHYHDKLFCNQGNSSPNFDVVQNENSMFGMLGGHIIAEHSPHMVILLETRLTGNVASQFVSFMQASQLTHVIFWSLGNGYSGVIWAFWDPTHLSASTVDHST